MEYIDRGLKVLNNENARRLAMTIAERMRQEGVNEVRDKMRILLSKQVAKRFGRISPKLEERPRQSDFDILDQFGESIFDFKDLKDAESWWENLGRKGHS